MEKGNIHIVCADNILKARQPLSIEVDYDKVPANDREEIKRVLTLDPGKFYAESDKIIDPFSRQQTGLSIEHFFPVVKNKICACGCERELPKRRTRWATPACRDFALAVYWIIYGRQLNISFFLNIIAGHDKVCMSCGEIKKSSKFENDHIVPVMTGGGGCWISNWQQICITCHKEKTIRDGVDRREKLKRALTLNTPTLF